MELKAFPLVERSVGSLPLEGKVAAAPKATMTDEVSPPQAAQRSPQATL